MLRYGGSGSADGGVCGCCGGGLIFEMERKVFIREKRGAKACGV